MAGIKSPVTAVLVVFICVAGIPQEVSWAVIASSTFDSDADGWMFDPTDTSWQPTGGNPGGYIRYDNNYGSSAEIIAPEKFLGDWSSLGQFQYDIKIFSTGNYVDIGRYQVYLKGPGESEAHWKAEDEPKPSAGWHTQVVELEEYSDEWTVISGSWDTILSDVTEFKIITAYYTNTSPFEITGIDNVIVPEPTTLLLLGIGGLLLYRRKNA